MANNDTVESAVSRIPPQVERAPRSLTSVFRWTSLLPAAVLAIALGVHEILPSLQPTEARRYSFVLGGLLAVYLILMVVAIRQERVSSSLTHLGPIVGAFFGLLVGWDLLTAKTQILAPPYFPSPDKALGALVDDGGLLGLSTLHSLRLLAVGYALGATVGLITGVLMGWSKRCHYWLLPGLRLIGPIPATAWIPIALTVFPTSFWASIFLIALAVWFPVTIMTSSGIANVHNSYFEVARTLGADQRYLIRKIAFPAAFPLIFIGLFMGLTNSFLTLIVAEMLGVKAGLGWYISWAQGFAEYGKVYASLVIISVIFSALITGLFKFKDRVLVWQKGLIKW